VRLARHTLAVANHQFNSLLKRQLAGLLGGFFEQFRQRYRPKG
jgi:hypothetical protein